MTAAFVNFSQDLHSLHTLPVPHNRSAWRALCIGPFRIAKSPNAILRVVQIEHPIMARCLPEPLTLNDELLAAPLRICLVAI